MLFFFPAVNRVYLGRKFFIIMKYLTILFAALAASAIFGAEFADVRVKKTDGSTVVRRVELKEIERDVFRCFIPKSEQAPGIEHIEILPDFARAKKGDDGYWTFSRGQYGRFTRQNGQYRSPTEARMPVFGMKTPSKTWVAIVGGYQLEFGFYVDAKDGEYSVYPRFPIKELGFEPYDDIIVDYHILRGADANYSGMARAYRKQRLERGEIKPLKERMKDSPYLEKLANTITIRFQFHAAKPWPSAQAGANAGNQSLVADQTPETEPKVETVLSFADAVKYMEALKAAGVGDLDICSAGWTTGGYDGRYPSLFPVCEEAGGEAGMKAMIKRAEELGYTLHGHAANMPALKISPRFSWDLIAMKADGKPPVPHMNERGGLARRLCLKTTWDKWVRGDIDDMAKLGFKGHYIDVFSAVRPHDCHSAVHPCTRKEMAEYQNKMLAYARRALGGVGSEAGFDHVAGNLDYINYVGMEMKVLQQVKEGKASRRQEKRWELVDGVFPLWEIVYHGIILYNPDRYTQNHNLGNVHENSSILMPTDGAVAENPRKSLKIVEFGGRPIYYTFQPSDTAAIKRGWDEFQPVKHLQTELIESHEEFAPNVFVVKYANGAEIVCNYNSNAFIYKGYSAAPLGYVLIEPKRGFWDWLF